MSSSLLALADAKAASAPSRLQGTATASLSRQSRQQQPGLLALTGTTRWATQLLAHSSPSARLNRSNRSEELRESQLQHRNAWGDECEAAARSDEGVQRSLSTCFSAYLLHKQLVPTCYHALAAALIMP